ncbi:LGFP repeat-containing protein [Egicoccus sp. AB-alg2]|uniref:LGFP repeat-containing protein n=1 Tax=Egicoccus sp. AB-alg2 TaxID=3242693 RepID=UPI00359E9B95
MTIAPAPEAEAAAPITVRVVDRLGRALAGRGLSRRRFLGRVAVVGSALAVGPIRYTLKPGTAYAQVCGTGASCSSGWTAFCCTVNNGANTCPPGSYAAGWWRIDDSPFCMGRARYVIDCNRSPSARCSCRCADDPCDQRRVCCNNFRYGQCNTQVAGVTEVVCRVVTCIAPWDWDPACNRTVRVDNRTRSHNSTCLPQRNATHIDLKYQDMGQTGSILGRPTTPERNGAGNGRYRRYENGSIFYRSATGALAVHGAIDARHRRLGGEAGELGYPTTEVRAVGDGTGLHTRYQRGTIWQRTRSADPVETVGRIDERYRSGGGATGRYGYPTQRIVESGGEMVRFQHSNLAAADGEPIVEVRHDMYDASRRTPAGADGPLGLAILNERLRSGGRYQEFQNGIVVETTAGELVPLGGALLERYRQEGGPGGSLGRPTRAAVNVAGGRGQAVVLANGTIYSAPGTSGTRLLQDPTLSAYQSAGGPGGSLGLPTSETIRVSNGQQRTSFEGGVIVIEPGGSVSVVRPRDATAPDRLASRNPARTSGRTPTSPNHLNR